MIVDRSDFRFMLISYIFITFIPGIDCPLSYYNQNVFELHHPVERGSMKGKKKQKSRRGNDKEIRKSGQ